jgi:hypothetical protein
MGGGMAGGGMAGGGMAGGSADAGMDAALDADASMLDGGGGIVRNDPKDPDHYDTFTPPDPKWFAAPATYSSGGVDFIDPFGALAGKTVTAVPTDPTTFNPPVTDQIAGWELSPTGPLSSIVFLRVPLPSPLTPGDLLLFNSYYVQDGPDPEGDDEWQTHAVATVLPDGMHAIAALRHFSSAAVQSYPIELQKFAQGLPCLVDDGGVDAGDAASMVVTPMARGEKFGTETPAQVAFTHDLGLCALDNVVPAGGFDNGTLYVKSDEASSSPNHAGENSYAHPVVGQKLATLSQAVAFGACGKLTVTINEMFDSDREHNGGSTHFAGRGVDLSPRVKGSGVKFYPGIGALARLAQAEAGFDFVWFETGGTANRDDFGNLVDPASAEAEYHVNDHVHASIAPVMGGPNPEDKLPLCHDHGVAGIVRSNGANGKNGPGGGGGSVVMKANGVWKKQKTNHPRFVLDAGKSMTLAGADLQVPSPSGMVSPGIVIIHGTLTLTQAQSTITSDRWVWVAPDGAIKCDGCNLTIAARGDVRIDGLVDLSPSAPGATGGILTVVQAKDTAPVLQAPAIDVRGGDGDAAAGGPGGFVSLDATGTDGDVVLGTDIASPVVPAQWLPNQHLHGAQEYLSTTTSYPAFLFGAIVTSGGVGGFAQAMNMTGFKGGAGGDVIVQGMAAPTFLGRVLSLGTTTIVTGGSWKSTASVPAPIEYFSYNDSAYQLGPDLIGVGSLGGQGYQGFGANLGSSGGPGGDGGQLYINAGGLVCPSFKSGAAVKSIVGNNYPNGIVVGAVYGQTASGAGAACSARWTTAGGSGGELGGSMNFPGNPGAAGAAGPVTILP